MRDTVHLTIDNIIGELWQLLGERTVEVVLYEYAILQIRGLWENLFAWETAILHKSTVDIGVAGVLPNRSAGSICQDLT